MESKLKGETLTYDIPLRLSSFLKGSYSSTTSCVPGPGVYFGSPTVGSDLPPRPKSKEGDVYMKFYSTVFAIYIFKMEAQ